MLSYGQDHPVRDGVDLRQGASLAAGRLAEQVLGLVAQLLEIRPGGEIGHDDSFASP